MNVIMSQEDLPTEGFTVFLAGPTPRSEDVRSWRPDVIELFQEKGFDGNLIVPEFDKEIYEFVYDKQIEWEHDGMETSDVVMFWIPRDVKGGMPAFTTNIEFGYVLASTPSKLAVGGPINADNNRYIEYMCNKNDINYHTTLDSLIDEIMKRKDLK